MCEKREKRLDRSLPRSPRTRSASPPDARASPHAETWPVSGINSQLLTPRALIGAPTGGTLWVGIWVGRGPALLGEDGGVHVHAGAQHQAVGLVYQDLHRNALHHLDEVSGGVLRGKQTQAAAGGAGDGINMARDPTSVHVHCDLGPLSGMDIGQLRLLEVGRDPRSE